MSCASACATCHRCGVPERRLRDRLSGRVFCVRFQVVRWLGAPLRVARICFSGDTDTAGNGRAGAGYEPESLLDGVTDDRDDRVARWGLVPADVASVPERVHLPAATDDPVAAPTRRWGHSDNIGDVGTDPGQT